MKLKFTLIALVAMLSSFAFTANAQTAVSSFDDLKAALANSTNIVVNGDIAVDEAITIPSGTTVAGDGTLHVQTKVYVVSTENPYPGVTYNKTATKNGSITGTVSCGVVYEISLDGGENWFTDTTNGKAQAVTVKKDGTKTISTSFQSAFTSAKCGEIVHMLKDAHVQSTNTSKNNGPLRSYYGLILEGNGHTIYTDVESSGASNEYSTIKFTSYIAGTGADVRPVLKNVTIDSQKNAKADLDLVSGDVTFTVSLFNVNLLNNTANATLSFISGTAVVINKSIVKLFDSSIPKWDAGSANAIEFYSGDYSLSFNNKCKVYGGSFSKDAKSYLAERTEMNNVGGKYVVTCKEEKVEAAPSVGTAVEGEIANELVANEAVANNSVELPTDVANFAVQLTAVESENEATTKVTFTVTPSNVLGEKVSTPTEAITFRLPVPAAWTGKAKVSHNGVELGVYDINEENGAKYVEVTSAEFSEFAVEFVEPMPITVVCNNGHTKDFESLAQAMRYGESCGIKEIVVHENITESMDILEGNIVTDNPNGVTIKNTIVDEWIYCDGSNFTIGEGITYDATGKASGLFVYGNNCVINGTVIVDCYYQRYAGTKLTINEPGSLSVTSETCIIRYMDGDANAGIYINGDNNDETIGLKLSVAYFYQGMINAKDASIQIGTYWQTNETDGQGSANLVLDNSTLKVTVNEHNFKATGNSTVTLTNNSSIVIAGGFETGANTAVSVDATSTIKDKNGDVPFITGEGTEANPYIIDNAAELVLFRNSVNAGETKYNAPGVWVALGADIDMTGIDWSVNIGDDCNATFDGIFDGKNFTISNLTATETAQKGDGYICTGLFGAIYGNAVVKNLTIENVTIDAPFTGYNVAAVVGFAYNATGSVENVTVTGDININAPLATGVGAIVGYGRSSSLAIENCQVIGNDGSSIVAKSYAGAVIGYSTSKNINANTVENVSITATGSVGAVAGIMLAGGSAADNTVKNVTLSATSELWANSVAVVAGTITDGSVTVSNTTVENVKANGAEASIVGGILVEKPTTAIAKVQAQIGDAYYTTFAKAYVVAQAGDVITMIADVNEAVTISGKTITLDLNGNKIYGEGTDAVAVNKGANVTIKNGTLETNGNNCGGVWIKEATAILENCTFVGTNADEACGVYASNGATVTINDCELYTEKDSDHHFSLVMMGADVTINGGTFKDYVSANGTDGYDDATLTINGGTFTSEIYWPANGKLTINGGTFTGETPLYVKSGSLEINGGTFTGNGEAKDYEYTLSGYVSTGAAAVIENVGGDEYDAITSVAINGGTFISKNSVAIQSVTAGKENVEAVTGFISGGTFSSDVTALCVAGFVAKQNENGMYGLERGLTGAGTEANPYLISNVADLEFFRASVNSGETKYNAPGVWVALAADIDLAGTTWTEGIGDGHNWSFDGNFDGKGYAIKNLTIEPYADANKYLCGGLFGYIYGGVTIKDLTIENATIDCGVAEGHNVGVLVGFANNNGGKANISNITVKGDIKVDAANAYGVGAIVGYSYREMGTISNCTVNTNSGSYINGCSFVGGITGYSYTGATIAGCSVKNIDITATKYSVGGIVGITGANNTVSDCAVENVTVNGEANVGNVVGAISADGIVVENCTAAQPLVGGNYSDNKPVEARNGNKYYATLSAALAAQGNEVTLLVPVTVAAGEEVTLDLQGKTVVGTPAETKAYAVITNYGDLTITNGTVLCNNTLAGSTAYAVNTIVNSGTLTVENATIENKNAQGNQIGYAIDNNSTSYDATVVIGEGAVIKVSGSAYYDGIRMFCNSQKAENNVVVEGGEVSSIWMQNPSDGAEKNTKDVKGSVTINGGKVAALYLEPSANFEAAITAGHVGEVSYFQTSTGRDLTAFITGGTFGHDVTAFCAEHFICQANGDVFNVVADPSYISEYTFDDANSVDFTNDAEKTVGLLTYKRTLIEGIWNPLYLPFEISVAELVENYDIAYYNQMISIDTDNDGAFDDYKMEVAYITTGTLRANYPYFIRPKTADDCELEYVAENVTLYPAVEKKIVTSSVANIFTLRGTHKAMSKEELDGWLAISLDGAWKPTTGIKAHRLYFKIEDNDNSPFATTRAKSIRIVVAGENEGTTGVEGVKTENGEVKAIYDLSGRRVLEAVKGGIYIVNGVKTLVK